MDSRESHLRSGARSQSVKSRRYEQLSLLERVLYHECFDGQDQGDRAEVPIKNSIDDEIFDGQAGDAIASPGAIASKFGEFWIEHQYKTIKGKQYGPYIVKRWRDENGRKRSRYLGKAPTADGDGSQQQKSTL